MAAGRAPVPSCRETRTGTGTGTRTGTRTRTRTGTRTCEKQNARPAARDGCSRSVRLYGGRGFWRFSRAEPGDDAGQDREEHDHDDHGLDVLAERRQADEVTEHGHRQHPARAADDVEEAELP